MKRVAGCACFSHEAPLHHAAALGHRSCVQTLIADGADVSKFAEYKFPSTIYFYSHTPLTAAILSECDDVVLDMINAIVASGHTNILTQCATRFVNFSEMHFGATPLYSSVYLGLNRSVEALLKQKLSVFSRGSSYSWVEGTSSSITSAQYTVLGLAVRCKKTTALRLFVENGVDVANFRTLLLNSWEQCNEIDDEHIETFRTCVELGYKCANKTNANELAVAVRRNSLPLAKIMVLDAGADVNGKASGFPILHMAVQNEEIFDFLVENGASLDVVDRNGSSLYHRAGMDGCTSFVEKFGDNFDCANRRGQTPLHVAVKRKNLPFVRKLISLGAQINAQDLQGNTAFHFAVKNKDEAMCSFLLKCGADFSIPNKAGVTAEKESLRLNFLFD